jgi:hypothetical protein
MVGYMPGYKVWMHHDESVSQTTSVAKEDDRIGDDRMDEMLDAIRPMFQTNLEDFPAPGVHKQYFCICCMGTSCHSCLIKRMHGR